MEIQFAPDVEKKLDDLVARTGREASELVQDALTGYFEEVVHSRDRLDTRYDELKSGKIELIPGDEVEAYFRDKSAARRFQSG